MPNLNIKKLNIDALVALRGRVESMLHRKGRELEKQLAQLGTMGGSFVGNGRPLKGSKVAPKYRSKKDPSLTWAGRGGTPRWLREEMKARKLKKEAFLIK
jgi:DNA-binding protein H-NS